MQDGVSPIFSWPLPVTVAQLSLSTAAGRGLQLWACSPAKPLLLDGPLLQTAGRHQATWAKSFLLITGCQLILQRKFLSTFLNSWTAFTRIAPSKTSKVQLYTKNIGTLVCATNMIIFYTHFILQTACGHAFTFTKRVFIFFQISSELK